MSCALQLSSSTVYHPVKPPAQYNFSSNQKLIHFLIGRRTVSSMFGHVGDKAQFSTMSSKRTLANLRVSFTCYLFNDEGFGNENLFIWDKQRTFEVSNTLIKYLWFFDYLPRQLTVRI